MIVVTRVLRQVRNRGSERGLGRRGGGAGIIRRVMIKSNNINSMNGLLRHDLWGINSSGGGGGGGGGGGRQRRGGGGGGGGLDPLEQSRHPEVAHGVLELLAVDVTFELLGVLLHTRSPVVLDLVVGSPRQMLRYFGPPIAPSRMEFKNQQLLF